MAVCVVQITGLNAWDMSRLNKYYEIDCSVVSLQKIYRMRSEYFYGYHDYGASWKEGDTALGSKLGRQAKAIIESNGSRKIFLGVSDI